ncbi:MAG: hypothetical protein EA422_12000 [Gemmatimonadales bacterium]|nr:MAG: hypothetical protein EA422_12000 [Gemmatimonadales bacterium]
MKEGVRGSAVVADGGEPGLWRRFQCGLEAEESPKVASDGPAGPPRCIKGRNTMFRWTRKGDEVSQRSRVTGRSRFSGARPSARGTTLLGIFLLLLSMSACASLTGAGAGAWDAERSGEDDFTLVVDNQSFNEARIYARWNGDRRRLGSVGGNRSQTFTLPWRAGNLRVEVDFLAAGGFVSEPVTVSPGDTIEFRIPPHAR